MELVGVRLLEWGGRARAVGSVVYEGAEDGEDYWFDVPADVSGRLATRGEAWLSCLLPLALQLGEALRIPLPVDRGLIAQAHELMGIWCAWWPGLEPVALHVPAADEAAAARPEAAFFSGGVDSFFSALESADRTDTLISVWGFDIPIADEAAFASLRIALEKAAASLGMGWCWVGTNLRRTRFRRCDWTVLGHGPALAAVAHALTPRFGTVRIASSNGYANLEPHGSHPMTDPLFSTRELTLEHHGAPIRRATKLERIAEHPLVLSTLRPCWSSWNETNCSRCPKCFCTMLHLDVLDVLHRCTTFDRSLYNVGHAAQIDSTGWEVRSYLEDVRALAERRNRRDVVRAIERGFRRTERRHTRIGRLRDRLRGTRAR